MAGYPPPPPFSVKPGDAERFARGERKREQQAQAAGSRAQRVALRQQRRKLRRNSILGPLLLVSIGVAALIARSGRIPLQAFLGWYGRWWPLLLVAAGVVLLVEWLADFFLVADGMRALPRRTGPGAALLLAGLAIAGASASRIRGGHEFFNDQLNLGVGDFDEFLGEKHESSQTIDEAFPTGTSLSVDNPHGNITVVGKSDDGQIHIVADKQVYSYSDSDAGRRAEQLAPRLSFTGGALRISFPKLTGATADLTIAVPNSAALTVTAHHGSVDLSSLRAPVSVTADHGDVELKAITGAVTAQMNRDGSSFTAHDITGDVSVRGHAQDLHLAGVDGQVRLEGEFFGNTHLERVHGPVAFHTNRTQLNLAQLPGELDISPESELTGSQMVGPTSLRTSSRNISFERITGDLMIANSRGSVDIKSAAPLGLIEVSNRDGAIRLTVPRKTGLTVDAETRGGEIRNDLGLASASQHGTAMLTGQVGDGASKINLRTTHLDIEIHTEERDSPRSSVPTARH